MRRIFLAVIPVALLAACSSSETGATTADSTIAPAISSRSYVTSDCAVVGGAPTSAATAPAAGVTLDGITVQLGKTPHITVAPGLAPASDVVTKTLAAGKGAPIKGTETLTFNYCGVGLVTQKQFDSSWANGAPITYGLDSLIPGWGVGMPGMKVGEERLLILPGSQSYGANPPTPDILPDESLAFVVQLVSVQK